MPSKPQPSWEALLSSAAHLQKIVPDAVLVGGTAAATYAHHRVSFDHDHTLGDLRSRFDDVLANGLGDEGAKTALSCFDELYPQPNGESPLMQLAKQLSNPLPFDLDGTNLEEYKNLVAEYRDWANVRFACQHVAIAVIQPML